MTGVDEQVLTPRAADTVAAVTGPVERTGAQLAAAFPPRPVVASWPVTEASRSAVLDRVLSRAVRVGQPEQSADSPDGGVSRNELAANPIRRQLAATVGGQRREDQPDWRHLVGTGRAKPLPHLSPGLLVLICADVIRPGLDWLLRFAPARHNLATEMARTRDPAAFAALAALCSRAGSGCRVEQRALTQVAVIMAVKGGLVEQVRVGDCVELLAARRAHACHRDRHANSPLFYQLLRAHGGLGPDAPAAIEMFSGRGQAQLRATDRPLPDRLPAGARRAGRLPARTAAVGGLLLAAA